MSKASNGNISLAYKQFEEMLRNIDGDEGTDQEMERLYPEPVLLRSVKEFIIKYCEHLSEVQAFDMFLILGVSGDVYVQLQKTSE